MKMLLCRYLLLSISHMSKSLLKSTSTVSFMTLISRIFGFIRDVLFAQVFGAVAGFDAFLVAFKVPNFMRSLFAEGAFSQAFVPVLSEAKAKQSPEFVKAFLNHMAGNLLSVLSVVTLIAVLAAPVFVTIFAPGFLADSHRFDLATSMLRLTFPYMLCISLVAFAAGIFNTYKRFAVPAFTPVLLNVMMIVSAVWWASHFTQPVIALAWGVFVAGFVQVLFQLPFLKRAGLLPIPIMRIDPAVKRVLKLMLPALVGVSVVQLSLLMDTLFASFLPSGSISWLYYSNRLVYFPLGVIGVALATVVLPHLSQTHSVENKKAFSATLDWALRLIFLIGVPAAIGLITLSKPLLITLFNYGAFTSNDVAMAQQSLMAYSVGLPAFMLVKILVSGFYARQTFSSPVKFAMVALVVNIILNLLLIGPLNHAGLALATALASTVNASLLFWQLRRRDVFTPQPGWVRYFLQLCVANGAMALWLIYRSAHMSWSDWSSITRVIHLGELVAVGIAIYFVVLRCLGIRFKTFLNHDAVVELV